ncbi:hypothetical protein RB195_002331 [Necator americanus]|uniref:Small ribosomal subunit protein mS25 n=2 Tax=Necator americanus TaxID=51031 RepID=A0ABR1DJ11_NECAM
MIFSTIGVRTSIMPFMHGTMPLRRTFYYLLQGKIKFRDDVQVFAVGFHRLPNEQQQGVRDFVFWHWAQLQYKNPRVQLVKHIDAVITPFARAYLKDGREVLFDLEGMTREEIETRIATTLGKTELVKKREELMEIAKMNPADFGSKCKRQCICEVQGQHPCTALLRAPKYMTGQVGRRSVFVEMNPMYRKTSSNSSESKHARRLREMFRIFQHSKERHREEGDPLEGKHDSPSSSSHSFTKHRKKPQHAVRSPSASEQTRHRRKADTRSAGGVLATRSTEDQDGSTAEKSPAEKRRDIRLKYGLNEKDEECYRKIGEEKEEFESVSAVVRPAATKMRKAKLKWKKSTDESEASNRDADKREKLVDLSGDLAEPGVVEGGAAEQSRIAEIRRRAGIPSKTGSDKGVDATMTEVQILIIRIEELELANRKATLQMKNMRKELREKNKKIEELTSLVTFLQKSKVNGENDEKPTVAQESVALRGLDIIKRNQLLEQTVRTNAERALLCSFFEAAEPKPTETIVAIIDAAFTNAIDVLLMRPDLFDDFVDNELRLFLLDIRNAKRILLDVMLSHPEYVPRAWGGDTLAKRQREEKELLEKCHTPKASSPEKKKTDTKTIPELKKAEQKPVERRVLGSSPVVHNDQQRFAPIARKPIITATRKSKTPSPGI